MATYCELRQKVRPELLEKLDAILAKDPTYSTRSDVVLSLLRMGLAVYEQQHEPYELEQDAA